MKITLLEYRCITHLDEYLKIYFDDRTVCWVTHFHFGKKFQFIFVKKSSLIYSTNSGIKNVLCGVQIWNTQIILEYPNLFPGFENLKVLHLFWIKKYKLACSDTCTGFPRLLLGMRMSQEYHNLILVYIQYYICM